MLRELSSKEIQAVNGGIAPLIGLGLSVAGHFMARTAASSFLGRAGLGMGVYGTAAYFGDK